VTCPGGGGGQGEHSPGWRTRTDRAALAFEGAIRRLGKGIAAVSVAVGFFRQWPRWSKQEAADLGPAAAPPPLSNHPGVSSTRRWQAGPAARQGRTEEFPHRRTRPSAVIMEGDGNEQAKPTVVDYGGFFRLSLLSGGEARATFSTC